MDRGDPSGPRCGRHGRRAGADLAQSGLGGGAGLVIDSYPVLFASRPILGVGAAAVFTCSTAALLGLYRGEVRDKVMGWRTTATTAGGFAYPLAAGALGNASWHAPFAIYLIGLPLGAATLFALPKTTPASQSDASAKGSRRGVVRLLREHPMVLALRGLWVATTGLMMVLAVSLPRRLDQLGIHGSDGRATHHPQRGGQQQHRQRTPPHPRLWRELGGGGVSRHRRARW
ncbi:MULTISPECIES: MFS transporter [Streptomyces]|uniref:MFS transporter n=1 Tax=Streptomyces lycopersici TaxID=2974589 RepID=UPI0021D02AA8|nr:MFS transporter [Streptomyces sp. NEAU-383]